MSRQPALSHGANLVANASFGTVLMVAAGIFLAALWKDAPASVHYGVVVGVAGAGLGYWLWRRQAHLLATTVHTGGLVGAGTLCLAVTETLGGPTAVLLLGSVITAGGLLGTRGALASICVLVLAIPAGLTWAHEIRLVVGFGEDPYVVPAYIVTVFVLTSIPSWAAYVVAIDASNRTAWLNAQQAADELAEANRKLGVANQQLQLRQGQLERAIEQQAAVARLGVYAAGTSSTAEVVVRASRLLERLGGADESKVRSLDADGNWGELSEGVAQEDRPFVQALSQLVQAHSKHNDPSAERKMDAMSAADG